MSCILSNLQVNSLLHSILKFKSYSTALSTDFYLNLKSSDALGRPCQLDNTTLHYKAFLKFNKNQIKSCLKMCFTVILDFFARILDPSSICRSCWWWWQLYRILIEQSRQLFTTLVNKLRIEPFVLSHFTNAYCSPKVVSPKRS